MEEQFNTPMRVMREQEQGLDFIQLLQDFGRHWIQIAAFVFVGTLASVILALSIDKEFEPSAELGESERPEIEQMNLNLVYPIETKNALKIVYDRIRSEEEFKAFLENSGYFEKLFPGVEGLQKKRELSSLTSSLSVEILEPFVGRGEFVEFPSLIQVSFSNTDEVIAVEILNSFMENVHSEVISELVESNNKVRETEITRLNEKLAILVEENKMSRSLEIRKRQYENELALSQLELEKEQMKALETKRLEVERKDVMEALAIATKLGVKKPTRFGDINADSVEASSAKIVLAKEGGEPLFLMGSEYLNSMLKIIDERLSDKGMWLSVYDIEQKIAKVKSDPMLAYLQSIEDSRPFITEYASISSQILDLDNKQFEGGARLFRYSKKAEVTGIAKRPNRKLIVILGFISSFFLALLYVLVGVAVNKRNLN